MATLSQAKTLGGVGAILVFIPFVSLVGYILIIVAVRDISEDLEDKTIFRSVVIAALTGIVGAIAGAFTLVVGAIGGGVTLGAPDNAAMLAGLLVAWLFLMVSAMFLRRAYGTMSTELGVGTFRTAATLYLVGAALTIVVVGFILLLVAQILQAMAFFSIPDHPPTKGAGASLGTTVVLPPSTQPQGGAAKFCASCGTQISPSAAFCYNCGAKQSQTPRPG